MFKTTILTFLVALPNLLVAQVTDSFTDGDFTSSPTWSGANSFGTMDPFQIVETDNQLRSSDISGGSGTRVAYLSTAQASAIDLTVNEGEWSFRLRNNFTVSASLGANNHSRVYIVSNVADLSADVDGYYIQLRDVADDKEEIRLYRQSGSTSTLLLTSMADAFTPQAFVTVRVTRSTAGLWEVFLDNSSQGTATDATHTSASHLGVQVRYTANSRSDGFFFDDFTGSFTAPVDTDPPTISSTEATTNTQVRLTFSESVELATSETSINYLLDNGITVTNADRDDSDNRIVNLTTTMLANGTNYTLTVNNVEDDSGNAILPGTTSNFVYVADLPEISSVEAISQTQVRVTFDVNMEAATAEVAANYSLNNGITISAAGLDAMDLRIVDLTTSQLTNGTTYTIAVSNVRDQTGETIVPSSTAQFEYLVLSPPATRDIVINEFIVDPDAATSLPNAEFVELYNPTDKFFDLVNFKIQEETAANSVTTSDPLGSFVLRPGSFVLVTRTSTVSLFSSFGQVLGVDGFPDFNQTNSSVVLLDGSDQKIDEIVYANEPPVDGISFEQINPTLPCQGPFNFAASTDASGGTPGGTNSVFDETPDTVNPVASEEEVVNSDSLVITFSEAIEPSTVSVSAITVTGFSTIAVELIAFNKVALKLGSALVSEQFYDVSFTNLADCSGNTVQGTLRFYYDVTAPVIEEIIVATDNSIFAIFDEPINESSAEDEDNYTLNQLVGVPDRATLQDTTSSRVLLTFESTFATDLSYQLSYDGIRDTIGNSGPSSATFDFRSEIDTVQAITANILQVRFKVRPSVASVTELSNFLAEDGGRPSEAVLLETDSSSVRLVFPEVFDDNDNLLLYVEGVRAAADDRTLITPAFTFRYDTDAPSVENLEATGPKELRVQFDEPIDTSTAINLSFYQLEDDAFPLEATASDSTVVLTFENDFVIEQEKTLTYTRIADVYGNLSTSNRREDFTYDPRAPQLDTAYQLGTTEVIIMANEALLFDSLKVTDLNVGGQVPSTIAIQGPDSSQVRLTFASDLAESSNLSLTIGQWLDTRGNKLTQGLVTAINSLDPQLVNLEAQTDTTIALRFSQSMAASAFEASSYDLEPLNLSNQSVSGDTLVTLKTSAPLIDGTNYTLHMQGLLDTNGRSLQFDTVSFEYDTFLEQLEVLDSITLLVRFDTEFTTITSEAFKVGGFSPVLASLDIEESGWVQLVVASPIAENQPTTLSWTQLSDRFGRELPDHVETFVLDTQLPTLIEVNSAFDGELLLTFSEPVDIEASGAPNQFQVVGVGNTASVDFGSETTATLKFSDLSSGTNYELVVTNFQDLQGNQQSTDTIAFVYNPPAVAPPGSIIITEIMADPSPPAGLPNEEYIELYNTTNTSYNLSALSLVRSSSVIALPELVLDPGEYIAFVDPQAASLFEGDRVIGLSGIPSFSNDGDSIVLQNRAGDLVDRVEYELAWYRDSDKDDGGFSLELINPSSDCGGAANWIASSADAGGTPGMQNSVFSAQPDSEAPRVLQVSLVDAFQLQVVFNEEMDPSTIVANNFQVTGLTITALTSEEPFQDIIVTFEQTIPPGVIWELEMQNVTDCSGNALGAVSIPFGLGAQPSFLDVIITEIFADPDPMVGLPDAEFLEIQNVSQELLSLDNMVIMDGTGFSQEIGGIIVPGERLVLAPSGELSEFVDLPVRGVSSWRSLTNTGERIALMSGDELIFQITFSSAWHDEDKQDGGYSLEMRDVTNPCGLESNWGSATAPSGGSPGEANSNATSIPDNFGPQLLDAFALTEDSVRLDFDETLLLSGGGTVLIEGIDVLNTSIFAETPMQMFLSVSPSLESGREYRLTTQNVRDCLGNIRDDNVAELVLPVEALPREVLLSEVLFNPKTEGFDFVEIYNTSTMYLSLTDWQIANATDVDVITQDELILGPQEYMVFTENTARLLLDYPLAEANAIIEVDDLPTLANNEGVVKIIDQMGRVQDSLSYFDDYHNPLLADVDGVSLERIDFSAPNNEDNWISSSSAFGFATPGFANSQSRADLPPQGKVVAEPKVFIPGSGIASFTTINYDFGTAGQLANITLFDQNGRLVRTLAEGLPLASSGFVTWDGTNDGGAAVRMGYYLIVFEVFAANGSSDIIKETVVVGRDF